MKSIKITSLVLTAAVLMGGCAAQKTKSSETTVTVVTESTTEATTTTEETTEATTTTEAEIPFKFNPHVYSATIAESFTKDHWTSFYNLCDALRAGEDTFECTSKEIYDWCMDPVTLCQLFPAACMKVTGDSPDGSVAFENGVGRIYYNMPKEEFAAREAEFETLIEEAINSCVKSSYDDFEKCLALYDYMTSEFTYNYDWPTNEDDGADYYCFMHKTGICCELGGIYTYLLMQVGVDAIQFGSYESLAHAWTYVNIDGEGYHIDPTWGLRSEYNSDKMTLDYFMMSEKDRVEDGFVFSEATVDLLPGFFVERSGRTFPATDDKYECLRYASFDHMDPENNILYYYDINERPCELKYA